MGRCEFRDGKVVEDYGIPYFTVEVNSSHNGNMDTARKMIDAAADAGGDCVKFQSWSAESLYSKTYYDANPISKRIVQKFSLLPEQLKELAGYCREKGIQFSSTPYSEEEVDFLVYECGVPYVKIASMEVNHLSFLKYIGAKDIPVVLSTGMSSSEEIERCIDILKEAGTTQMAVLHCVSLYPTELKDACLNNIIGLREKYHGFPIGFSDHTVGGTAAVAAVALGAALIEKHMTLDRRQVGMDNNMAAEPEELKLFVTQCKDAWVAMGSKERILSDAELEQRKNMRRSITAAYDLPKGTVIREEDLYAKRPGTGISPDQMEMVVGKTTKVDIAGDTLIMPGDIQ